MKRWKSATNELHPLLSVISQSSHGLPVRSLRWLRRCRTARYMHCTVFSGVEVKPSILSVDGNQPGRGRVGTLRRGRVCGSGGQLRQPVEVTLARHKHVPTMLLSTMGDRPSNTSACSAQSRPRMIPRTCRSCVSSIIHNRTVQSFVLVCLVSSRLLRLQVQLVVQDF